MLTLNTSELTFVDILVLGDKSFLHHLVVLGVGGDIVEGVTS
jgi:hypothetical protein